jgi:hypothetical protein
MSVCNTNENSPLTLGTRAEYLQSNKKDFLRQVIIQELTKRKRNAMNEKNSNRTRVVTMRLTTKEYSMIEAKFKTTTCQKLSKYMRNILLEKKVTVFTRNQSLDDFMAELILLRNELNAVGNNFNQVVKRRIFYKHYQSSHLVFD